MKVMVAKMDDTWTNDEFCDGCRLDFYMSIDQLVKDVQRLEAKVVCLRYSLSLYLPKHDGRMLRCDIFSDLAGGYYDQPAYQRYVDACYGGQDPMEQSSYVRRLLMLSKGKGGVDY